MHANEVFYELGGRGKGMEREREGGGEREEGGGWEGEGKHRKYIN